MHVAVRTATGPDTKASSRTVVLEANHAGPGVDRGTVDRLVEPSRRARSRVPSDGGHGLAIVRPVVRATAARSPPRPMRQEASGSG